MSQAANAIVLGAGIQGVCAALALAERGIRVTLVEQCARVMEQASLRNEGKIHLGFVYAKDDSGRTPALMLDAALRFAPLLERWLGRPLPWEAIRSRPFLYGLLADSMLDRDALLDSYTRLQERYSEQLRSDRELHYFGRRPHRLWNPPGERERAVLGTVRGARALIPTVEVALALPCLRGWLERALAQSDGVVLLPEHRVEGVVRTDTGFEVSGERAGGSWAVRGDVVVNCLWANRLALDRAFLGAAPTRKWVYRLKYRLLGQLPPRLRRLPSMTFVLGPFGDVVSHPRASTYFSWYPSCLQGWSQDLCPPDAWQDACRGRVDPVVARAIAESSLSALAEIVPGIEASVIDTVDAGVIVSWGDSDIDDVASELHQRFDIGVSGVDGYYSIDSGKFTTAPLFAARLAGIVG